MAVHFSYISLTFSPRNDYFVYAYREDGRGGGSERLTEKAGVYACLAVSEYPSSQGFISRFRFRYYSRFIVRLRARCKFNNRLRIMV